MKNLVFIVSMMVPVSLLAVAPPPAEAQTGQLTRGDTIWITDFTNRQVEGVVLDVAPSTLTVRTAGVDREWRTNDMREVWKKGDPLRNGVVIGALSGGGTIGTTNGRLVPMRPSRR